MTDTTLVQALANVMAELPAISKKKHPSENGKGLTYAYRGIEEITSEVQNLFATHGVVIVPQVRSREVVDIVVNGNPWTDTFLEVGWLICGHGEQIPACTFGVGRDNSDKGTNKAMTQAFKYLLLDLLCISDPSDDNDGTNTEADSAGERRASPNKGASDKQIGLIKFLVKECHLNEDKASKLIDDAVGRPCRGFQDLSSADASKVIEKLNETKGAGLVTASFGTTEDAF